MRQITGKIRLSFTLVEIIVAMSIFALLMLMIMQIFGAMQNVWSTTSSKTKTYQNIRTVMDIMTADLQSAYYNASADPDHSWCYIQSGDFSTAGNSLWFVTSRQKSVQAKNSSLVQTGYWTEQVTRDGLNMLCLKNAIVSNIGNRTYYNFNTAAAPASGLLTYAAANRAVILDNNIVDMKILPFYRIKETDGSYKIYNLNTLSSLPDGPDGLVANDLLPSYISIEMYVLDDTPEAREKCAAKANLDEKRKMCRKFSRIIEIDRMQRYEATPAGGS